MANYNEVFCGNCSSLGYDMEGRIQFINLPPSPMRCIKTGATSIDNDGNNTLQNMDIFECEFCKNRVTKR